MSELAEKTCIRAAEIVRERGWCQNTMTIGDRVCASYALILAGRDHGDVALETWGCYTAARALVVRRLRAMKYIGPQQATDESPYISDYNDEEERTVEDIIALLEGSAS